jgi:hypothetical protein
MSFQADFYSATDVFQRNTLVRWTWEMADVARFMYHDVVPRQANQTVEVTRRLVVTDNDLSPSVVLDVSLTPAPGLLNFFAIRVPPLS